jgi:processed acidic surface protein
MLREIFSLFDFLVKGTLWRNDISKGGYPMSFKKIVMGAALSCQLLLQAPLAMAAPPENELNQYLAEIGWTKEELLEYLDYYEIPLSDFASVEELKMVMGTPITPDNFQELLVRYHLTDVELHALMGHFGDSLEEYKFIEDLDAAVDFYVNHDEYMAETENEFEKIGITEEETERLFQYLTEVEERNKDQLDQAALLDARMEKFIDITDAAQLTDEELDELVDILNETVALYEISVKYTINNQEIALKELLKMKEPPTLLLVSVFSDMGELLMDFNVPEEFFETGEVMEEGEEMLDLGELSDEFVDHMHEEKHENAKGSMYK